MSISLILMHFTTFFKGGALEGSPLIIISLTVGLSSLFGNNFNFIFWTLLTLSIFVITAVLEMFFTDISAYLEMISLPNYLTFKSTFLYYLCFIDTILIFIGIIVTQKYTLRKITNQIDKIGDSILSLDFGAKEIKKLEEKPFQFSSKTERLFKGVIKNLKKYSLFLPDSITRVNHDSDQSSTQKTSTSASSISTGSTTSANSSNSINSNGDVHFGKPLVQRSSQKIESKERTILFGLNSRDVVVMMVQLLDYKKVLITSTPKPTTEHIERKFHHSMDKGKLIFFENSISSYLNKVCEIVYRNKGIVDQIGNCYRVTISFNAQNINTEPSKNAVATAMELHQHFHEAIKVTILKKENMMNGIVKTKFHSSFQLVSPKLEIFDFTIGDKNLGRSNINIFVDQSVMDDVKYEYVIRQVHIFHYKDFREVEKSERIFRIIKKSSNSTNEWLYQIRSKLDSNEDNDETEKQAKLFNLCWKAFEQNSLELAKNQLHSYIKLYGEDEDTKILQEFIQKKQKDTDE